MKLGFVTANENVFKLYFPTVAEPNLLQKEPHFTPDDQLVVDYLRSFYGFEVLPVIWGTPVKQLVDFEALVIRSPWDYMDSVENRQKFMEWLGLLSKNNIKVFNDVDIANWLLDKHYLKDFFAVGMPIVPTEYYEKNAHCDLTAIYNKKGSFVVKPAISAAGKGLKFISSLNDAKKFQSQVNAEIDNSCLMVQDYIPEIKTNGEWSLIFFGGEYSHSVKKMPSQYSILVQAEKGGKLILEEPNKKIIDFAKNVISNIEKAYLISHDNIYNNILYIRVDIIESKYGPLLSELEGVEPELFFRFNKFSIDLFAKKLVNLL